MFVPRNVAPSPHLNKILVEEAYPSPTIYYHMIDDTSKFSFHSLKELTMIILKTEPKLSFGPDPNEIDQDLGHGEIWKLLRGEFKPLIDLGHKLLLPRIFLDEFQHCGDSKRKVYGLYYTLLNFAKKEYNVKRYLIGIVPESGLFFSESCHSCS